MTARVACYAAGLSLYASLTAGCLLRSGDAGSVDANLKALEERQAVVRAEVPPESVQVEPPPPPSDYQPRPVPVPGRFAASLAPQAPAKGAAEEAEIKPPPPPPPAPPPTPPPPEPPIVAALRCALQKHPDEARRLLDKYDKTDRELLLALLKLTAGVGVGEVAKLDAKEMTATLEQLTTLTAHLRHAPLSLDRVCCCRRIDGFGQYEALPASHEFRPGSEGRPGERVHLYAELRNFASRVNAEGQFETTLASSLEIVDLHGRRAAALDLGRCVDRCQARRQDYFLNVQFHVPAGLPAGTYTLRVKVEDQTPGAAGDRAGRTASRSVSFRVGAGK